MELRLRLGPDTTQNPILRSDPAATEWNLWLPLSLELLHLAPDRIYNAYLCTAAVVSAAHSDIAADLEQSDVIGTTCNHEPIAKAAAPDEQGKRPVGLHNYCVFGTGPTGAAVGGSDSRAPVIRYWVWLQASPHAAHAPLAEVLSDPSQIISPVFTDVQLGSALPPGAKFGMGGACTSAAVAQQVNSQPAGS